MTFHGSRKRGVIIKRYIWIFLTIIILSSLGFNVFMANHIANLKNEESKYSEILVFENANSRDTIFSIHNIKKAQEITKGQGVKVGIIDHFFGFDKHQELYAGGANFANNVESFQLVEEHGYWLALTLREVAPKVEIYALNFDSSDENCKVDSMINAINWAIDNELDVLTYSSSRFSVENEKRLNEVVQKAIENNIVTTFIHYYYEENILPDGLFEYKGIADYNRREPDLNIFHYDYNVLILPEYFVYEKLSLEEAAKHTPPFTSISSTSPITAGFVALLKSINNDLKPFEYKNILRDTSKVVNYEGEECPRVVDIYEAVQSISTFKTGMSSNSGFSREVRP